MTVPSPPISAANSTTRPLSTISEYLSSDVVAMLASSTPTSRFNNHSMPDEILSIRGSSICEAVYTDSPLIDDFSHQPGPLLSPSPGSRGLEVAHQIMSSNSEQQPAILHTVPRYCFWAGFLFPVGLLWIAGALFIHVPFRFATTKEEPDPKRRRQLDDHILRIRQVERIWARRCTYALIIWTVSLLTRLIMGDRQQLLDMGFDAARVDWALKATKNSGLLTALDHLENNSEKPIPSAEDLAEDEDEEMGGDVKVGAEAKSIKCSECQKIFKNPALASFHGEKSGHTQFEESTEEIKPLTEEEKKQRLQELREKMAAKRAVKSVEEIEENKKNEALRRKAGKDAGDAIESLQLKQANKEALERKREKEADAKARAAVKAQIEADKKARAEKTAREKALREGRVPDQPSGGFDVSGGARGNQGAAPVVAKAGADFAQTRLQVRLASGGQPLTKSFPSTSTLTEVEEWLASESLSINVGGSAVFSTRHPPKTFARNEFSRSLQELGLTPSAVLFVQQ